jgi:hypothetical protein
MKLTRRTTAAAVISAIPKIERLHRHSHLGPFLLLVAAATNSTG